MQARVRQRLLLLAVAGLLSVSGAAWYVSGLSTTTGVTVPQNSILVLAPYRFNGTWVFDDERVGLVREPFVAGVPEMIDGLVSDIPDAADGFRLTVSAKPFPGYESKLAWLRGDREGNFYRLAEPPTALPDDAQLPDECWICPALFKYFEDAPAELYVKADPAR